MAGEGMLQSADKLLAPAVAETIAALPLTSEDAAAVRLAERYAQDIDEATLVHATLTKVLREVAELDVDLYDRLLPLAVRIERTAVLASIGPKLLAALEQLGATVPVRAKLKSGSMSHGESRLQALREARRP